MSLKNIKKGDTVIVKGFTGIKLGVFDVAKATEKNITVEKKDGSLMIFSKKSGKQTNVEEGKEKYANSVMENDGSYVAPKRGKKKAKKTVEKPKKKEEPEEIEDLEEDDDFEELDDEEE